MKKFLLVVLVLALVFSMAGCGQKTESAVDNTEDPIVIGFVPMTMNNEYFITMVNGAKQKAEELGVQLDVQAADQHASAAAQLTIVENMITAGVDGICIVPSSSEGLSVALQKCKEAGIPVINLDTKINKEVLDEAGLSVPFFGTDNYAGAASAGEYVLANLKEGIDTAILTGIEGQQNAADRRNGFYDVVKDKVNVVAEQSANWEVDQGYTATQNIISANPTVELIFASNDGMAIGAISAVEEAGLSDQIQIIGFDAISEALNLVESGNMLGTVAQYPAEMGILGVENVVKSIKGEEVEMFINTGANLITADNVAEHKAYSAKFAE